MQGSLLGNEDWHNDFYAQVAQAGVDAYVDGAGRRGSTDFADASALLLVAESKAETGD
jgi:hypothetical protein